MRSAGVRRCPASARCGRTATVTRSAAQAASAPVRLAQRPRCCCGSVTRAARRLGFTAPTLWLNDVTYAPLISGHGLAECVRRHRRLAARAVSARETRRCVRSMARAYRRPARWSSARLRSRRVAASAAGDSDSQRGRRGALSPRPRPADRSAALAHRRLRRHAARGAARRRTRLRSSRGRCTALSVVLVGPDALAGAARTRAARASRTSDCSARPYDARARLSPARRRRHRAASSSTPFTESLDPIKAYECLAVDTPTVATPVAGFRELADWMTIAPRASFVDCCMLRCLRRGEREPGAPAPPAWTDRASSSGASSREPRRELVRR